MKSGWTIKKLGEVCELINGKNQSEVTNPSGEYPIYGSGGVIGRADDFRCPASCTIIGRKGSINNPLYVTEPFWNVDTAYALSPAEVEPKFLYYFCLSFDFSKLDCGTTIPSLTSAIVKDVDMPIPPLPEQKRIVAKIDAAFEKIDKLKANAERNLANAKELFQSALDEAMRPKKGWLEKRLGEVADFYAGHTPKPIDLNGVDGIPYFKVSDMNRKGNEHGMSITELFVKRPKKVYPKGGIAFPKNGGAALTNKKRILQQDSVVDLNTEVICAKEMMGSEFLFYLFSSFDVCEYIRGAALPTVDMAGLRSRVVFLPSLNEQKQIVKRLDVLAGKTKLLEQHYTRQIADCAEMRQSVLRAAFEGGL